MNIADQARDVAAAVNSFKNKISGSEINMEDLRKCVRKIDVNLQTPVLQILMERGFIVNKRFSDKIVPYTVILDIFDKNGEIKKEYLIPDEVPTKTLDNFKNMLLDIQYFQRNSKLYSLQKLLEKYKIYTFPKKNIPDISSLSINADTTKNLYKQLVLDYRRSVIHDAKESKDDTEDKLQKLYDNVDSILTSVEYCRERTSIIERKINCIIKHFKISLE